MLVRFVQPAKQNSPSEVTELGMETLVRPVQPQKALSNEVTEFGMVTLARLVQPCICKLFYINYLCVKR